MPLLALNFIIKTSFFCTIFLIFSAIVQDKNLLFTTFDYIMAVIQALQFVVYKDVLRFYFFEILDGEGLNYPGYLHILVFFLGILR
jgi:hypothetical protein